MPIYRVRNSREPKKIARQPQNNSKIKNLKTKSKVKRKIFSIFPYQVETDRVYLVMELVSSPTTIKKAREYSQKITYLTKMPRQL